MNPDIDQTLQDDPRILRAAREYLADLENGRPTDRQKFFDRHPELIRALTECFDGIDLAHGLGARGNESGAGRANEHGANPGPDPRIAVGVPPFARAGNTIGAPTDDAMEPLGDFKIVREIGRGGMGVVYEATQLSLGRKVALKVLPFAAGMDAKHLQRFKNEAYAAAQLHHTNIVPVYAVGCERGVHYYAMQLIEGRTLAAVIEELRGQQAAPNAPTRADGLPENRHVDRTAAATEAERPGAPKDRNNNDDDVTRSSAGPHSDRVDPDGARANPSPPTHGETVIEVVRASTIRSTTPTQHARTWSKSVAKIGVQVAEALAYAHDAGVVHRDIKPANLLVDGKNAVWIADFGLAQVQADAGMTRTGDIIGTLRYMSPEQAAGRRGGVDHRTDIYSLGATLYELLALRPIFDAPDRHVLLHRILNDEPPSLRALAPSTPIELETIIFKCISKNPDERYASAADVSADLSRFLEDRPILARRPSLWDHVRKWARRHPTIVGAAVLILFLSTIGLAISTAIISQEKEQTANALQLARQRAEEAESRFDLAKRVADRLREIAEDELGDHPMYEDVRRRLLESSLEYYQEFIDLRRDDASAQVALAETQMQIRGILDDLEVLQNQRQAMLLRIPGVLRDISASEEQKKALTAYWRAQESAVRDLLEQAESDPTEKRGSFLRLARENDAKLRALLTPQQLSRVRQIFLQVQGPMALLEPATANKLSLTRGQKEQVRNLQVGGPPKGGKEFGMGPPIRGFDGPGTMFIRNQHKKKSDVSRNSDVAPLAAPSQAMSKPKLVDPAPPTPAPPAATRTTAAGSTTETVPSGFAKPTGPSSSGPTSVDDRSGPPEFMMKILTPEQVEIWRQMNGRRYEGPRIFGPGGFGAPGGRGGRNGPPPDGPGGHGGPGVPGGRPTGNGPPDRRPPPPPEEDAPPPSDDEN